MSEIVLANTLEHDRMSTVKEEENLMKTFKIFQIHLTDAEVDAVNEAGDHFAVPKQAARVRLQFGTDNPKAADDLVKKIFDTSTVVVRELRRFCSIIYNNLTLKTSLCT